MTLGVDTRITGWAQATARMTLLAVLKRVM